MGLGNTLLLADPCRRVDGGCGGWPRRCAGRSGGPGGRAWVPARLDFGHGRSPNLAVMSASTLKVLVTGGTSGLGLAMAAALAEAGARVALTGRSATRASAVAAELP